MTESVTANDLANKSLTEVKTWLVNISPSQITSDSEFNWLGFAFVAGSNARKYARENEKDESLGWAEISLKIYEKLSETSDQNISHSCEMSAMTLRVYLIDNFGDLKGNYVLDSQIIINWFYNSLDLTFDEVLEESSLWNNLNHEEKILRLKTSPDNMIKIMRIKNRLVVIDSLQKTEKIELNDDLKLWLKSRKQFA
jgi:hypothetical protein